MKNPCCACLLVVGLTVVGAGCGRTDSATSNPASSPESAPLQDVIALPTDLDIPSDLPGCPGLLEVSDHTGNARTGSLNLLSSQRADALADFYTGHLSAGGWIMASSLAQGGDRHIQFRKGPRFLRLQMSPAQSRTGQTYIRMAWGAPDHADLNLEAHAPDYEEDASEIEPASFEW